MDYSFVSISLDLFKGFIETLKIFTMTLLISLPLGLIFSFLSMSKYHIIKSMMKSLIWIIRGTPLMLQLLIVYYGPGLLFEMPLLPVNMAVYLTFGLNYACYFSEIYRGGIESIPKGQIEAGKALGLSYRQIFVHILLIQVIKRILAPMSNEVITLVKDTAIARIITYYEIIFHAQRYIKTAGLIWPLFFTGFYYLIFCGTLTILFYYFEKRLSIFGE